MIREIAFAPTDNGAFSPLSSLVEWLVPVDTKVEAGQPLFLYETDKAIATFFSPVAGHVRRIMIAAASRFSRGTILA
jgi:pyruvate/2-oxoglutarate dehydrogenase complex dihydrolipoamide acyltransferase (E2) component